MFSVGYCGRPRYEAVVIEVVASCISLLCILSFSFYTKGDLREVVILLVGPSDKIEDSDSKNDFSSTFFRHEQSCKGIKGHSEASMVSPEILVVFRYLSYSTKLTVQSLDVKAQLSILLHRPLKVPDEVTLCQDQLTILFLVARRCFTQYITLSLALCWRRHGWSACVSR